MASLSKSKHLFGFTSPRTLEKIVPEIELLAKHFSEQKWQTTSQIAFFDVLFHSEFYDGEKYPSDPALAARDRITRSPKALGFIQLSPTIQLTKAGNQLITGKRLPELFTKQLLKFQLPSPYHTQSNSLTFGVKPYLELLRLIDELGSLSKTEIALFFLQLIHYERFDMVKEKILAFRNNRKAYQGNKKQFVADTFKAEIELIFQDEIKAKNFKTRESHDISYAKFLKTKESNMRDYADAFFRYIRATELVTVDKNTLHLKISEFERENVKFLLANTPREPKDLSLADYQAYLFDPDALLTIYDDKNALVEKLVELGASKNQIVTYSIEQLKDELDSLINQKKAQNHQDNVNHLKLRADMAEIYEMFTKISKKEVPDAPLFLEWNTWRAFAALNHTDKIVGNFVTDLEGMPLSTATGNKADIEIKYQGFSCIVEVTMSSGETQFNMEGSSVPRHYGDMINSLSEQETGYCFFIAPKISDTAKAHFFNLNRFNTKRYGGKTKIIPMNLGDFTRLIQHGIENNFSEPVKLKDWLDKIINFNQQADDEEIWFTHIQQSLTSWIART